MNKENNLSVKSDSFACANPFKCSLLALIAGFLLFFVNLPTTFISAFFSIIFSSGCLIIAGVFLAVSISYKENYIVLLALIPRFVLSLIYGNFIDIIFPLFTCLVALSAVYSVKRYQEKRATIIITSFFFFLLLAAAVILSMLSAYGSLSVSAFSTLYGNIRAEWMTIVQNASSTLDKEIIESAPELFDTLGRLLIFLSIGISIGFCILLGIIFTSLYYRFISQGNGYSVFIAKEGRYLKLSMFAAILYFISSFLTFFIGIGLSSSIIIIIFANISLIYFPLFLSLGIRSLIIRIKIGRAALAHIIFLGITFFISPIYPIILISLTGSSDAFAFSIQQKLNRSGGSDKDK